MQGPVAFYEFGRKNQEEHKIVIVYEERATGDTFRQSFTLQSLVGVFLADVVCVTPSLLKKIINSTAPAIKIIAGGAIIAWETSILGEDAELQLQLPKEYGAESNNAEHRNG